VSDKKLSSFENEALASCTRAGEQRKLQLTYNNNESLTHVFGSCFKNPFSREYSLTLIASVMSHTHAREQRRLSLCLA
jgi:hypothetical protein